MGDDGVGPVGNGALSATGNIAVEENLTRKTLGETVLMFSGALNKKVLDKNCYRGESVQSDIVRNGEQKPFQHKMQNIQCNRSTVCFAIAASLAALIVALVYVTQTYIFLAAFVIPASVGLYWWSLYKEEKENKPSSNIEGDIKVKGASHNMMHQGGQHTLFM